MSPRRGVRLSATIHIPRRARRSRPKTLQPMLDSTLMAEAQRAAQYEIAAYESLIAWAESLGMSAALEPLVSSLEQQLAAEAASQEQPGTE